MGYHIAFAHKYEIPLIQFAVLDCITEDPRGGDFDQRVLQRETQWIYRLKANCWPGLNDSLSFKSFLYV